jgi:hypothetical protein
MWTGREARTDMAKFVGAFYDFRGRAQKIQLKIIRLTINQFHALANPLNVDRPAKPAKKF